uniref:Uncharacterized protein n=1 Tax=Syphacia muris TaxID=451379 RepID=A0A0N5A8T8_9BILA
MADAGFYRGTSSEQDSRFTDKERKLLKQMRFDGALDQKVHFKFAMYFIIIFIWCIACTCIK